MLKKWFLFFRYRFRQIDNGHRPIQLYTSFFDLIWFERGQLREKMDLNLSSILAIETWTCFCQRFGPLIMYSMNIPKRLTFLTVQRSWKFSWLIVFLFEYGLKILLKYLRNIHTRDWERCMFVVRSRYGHDHVSKLKWISLFRKSVWRFVK